MTTDKIFYLIKGSEPFLAITTLNILLAIWILVWISRNHRDITAVKKLLTDMRHHEATTVNPVTFSNEQDIQPSPETLKPLKIKVTTGNSKIDGFLKAIQEGTDIGKAAKQFHLTEDEARVTMVSYRTSKGLDEKSNPIF
jgi:hypothetical protein